MARIGRWNVSIKNVIVSLVSLALIGAGAALILSVFLAGPGGSVTADDPQNFNVPVLQEETRAKRGDAPRGPKDKTLTVTIPKIEVAEAAVPDAVGTDERKLEQNLGIHLRGTGFPWEDGANVYIAGHRLGFPGKDSYLAFYDLDKLRNGDEITVSDANGEEYVYRVFKEFIVDPTNLAVTQPVPGKDVLTLQTCTLPDYSKRLIVQAEKVA